MSFRSWTFAGPWFLLLGLALGAGTFEAGTAPFLISLLLFAYALQGLLSELMGVSVDSRGVSAPNRLVARAPLLTMWRTSFPRKSFDRIDRYDSKAVAIFTGGRAILLPLPNARDRMRFLAYCKKTFPEVHISM